MNEIIKEDSDKQYDKGFLAGVRWLIYEAEKIAVKPDKYSTTQFEPFISMNELAALIAKKIDK